MQAVATPFLFERLLRGVEHVPYVFSHVICVKASTQRPPQGTSTGADRQELAAQFPSVAATPHAASLSSVRSAVHAALGFKVSSRSTASQALHWEATADALWAV